MARELYNWDQLRAYSIIALSNLLKKTDNNNHKEQYNLILGEWVSPTELEFMGLPWLGAYSRGMQATPGPSVFPLTRLI